MVFRKFNYIFFIVCVFFVNHLSYAKSDVTITVWVHGTYPVMNALIAKRSPVRAWVYTEPGLSLAKKLPFDYYFNKLAHELHARKSEEYNINHFYTYGWYSSKVRPAHRRAEGEKLYHALVSLLKDYKSKYNSITLRLIGMSHGGNVVLHCLHNMPFFLEGVETEVILLATPIQEPTRAYVNNINVKRVYSFYSDIDWIQRIDAQKFHSDAPKGCSFWSNRTFEKSDRVVQVRLKIDGKFIGHGTYRSIVKYLPEMIKSVDNYIGEQQDKAHVLLNFKTH